MYAALKRIWVSLAILLAIVAISSAGHRALSVFASPRDSQSLSPSDSALSLRISRIENGLLPAVVIKGQPPAALSIAGRMAHYKVPGVSMAFFDHGQIVWTRSYGLADVSSKKPVTPDTLFQAASISKPVTALAALRLVQQGKLNLDENVNLKLKAWKVPENEFTSTEKVTIRRILSHSAGLTVHGFPGYAAGKPVPTILQILNGEKPANSDPILVDVVPGTLWRYSGGGYVVLQLLLTEVTGQPFPKLMHDLVLQPIGMTHSTFDQPLPKNLWPQAATPYRANGHPVEGGWHTYPEMAPAGLWTTPSDLARLAIEVQAEYEGKSSKVLNQATAREMLKHQTANWGLGFGLENPGAKPSFSHGGGNEGFRCYLFAYTDSGQGLAIMTNSDSGGELMNEILRSVAHEYGWPDYHPVEHTLAKADPSSFTEYAGVYEIAGVGKLTVTTKSNSLFIQADPLGPEPVELLPDSSNQFFVLSADISFTFDRLAATGPVYQLTIHAGPQTLVARKIS